MEASLKHNIFFPTTRKRKEKRIPQIQIFNNKYILIASKLLREYLQLLHKMAWYTP